MNKCKNCGMEFVGRFCPECGAKLEEPSVCPNCGSTVVQGSRFCNLCGTSLKSDGVFESPTPDKETAVCCGQEQYLLGDDIARPEQMPVKEKKAFINERSLSKIHTVLKYLPAALFALYSLLMFAFFAADVAYFEADGGYFGVISESFGTVYVDITKTISGITGCIVALYLFLIISLALSTVTALSLFAEKFKNKTVRIGKSYIARDDLLVYMMYALYFIFFIIAIAMMAIVSSFSDGIDEICVGGAPKLILAFAIIFGVFSVAAKIFDRIVCKKFPQIYINDKELREKSVADRIAADERKREQIREISVSGESEIDEISGDAFVLPSGICDARQDERKACGSRYVCLGGKPVFRRIKSYVRLSRTLLGIGIAALLFTPFCIAILIGWQIISRNITVYCALAVFAFYALIGALCAIPPVRRWSTTELCKTSRNISKTLREKTKTIGFFIVASGLLLFFIVYGLILVVNDVKTTASSLPAIYLISFVCLFDIAGIIACTLLKSRKKQLTMHFFGVEKPNESTPEKIIFDLEKEKAFAAEYKRNKKITAFCADSATYRIGALRLIIICLSFVGIIISFCIFNAVLSPFRASYVSLMGTRTYTYSANLSNSYTDWHKGDVRMFLGEPDVAEAIGDDGEMWAYFDGEYLSVYTRAKELGEKMEQAVESGDVNLIASLTLQLEKLRNDARNMIYKSLLLYFGEWGYLTEIRLNTCARGDGFVPPKTPVETSLECSDVFMSAFPANTQISYSSSYTDGSYRQSVVSASELSGLTAGEIGAQKVIWSDNWATYSATVIGVHSARWKHGDLDYSVEYVEKTGRVVITISGNISDSHHANCAGYESIVNDLILNITHDSESMPALYLPDTGILEHIYIKKNSDYVDISGGFNGGIWSENAEIPYNWSLSRLRHTRFGDEWELVDGTPHIVKERTYIDGAYICSVESGDMIFDFNSDGTFNYVSGGSGDTGEYILIGDKLIMNSYAWDYSGIYLGTVTDNNIVIHGKKQDFDFSPLTTGDITGGIAIDEAYLHDTIWYGEIQIDGETMFARLSFGNSGKDCHCEVIDSQSGNNGEPKYSFSADCSLIDDCGYILLVSNYCEVWVAQATDDGIKFWYSGDDYMLLKKIR